MCRLWVTVRRKCLDHAPDRNACGCNVPHLHLTPSVPNPLEIVENSICTNDAAERVSTSNIDAPGCPLPRNLLRQEIITPNTDTGLAHGAKQHLVHRVTHGIDHGKCALHIPST